MSARVRARGVGVEFLFDKQRRLVSPTLARVKARRAGTSSWGLRDIDLDIGPGEAVALVGRSGGGKTTLLRTIAGVFTPDAGTIEVEGRIGALLSVGAGVMSPLTGRENAQLLGVLAGLSVRDARRATPNVQVASGLGNSFDRPVSSYSQGMRARLGFATADEANPTILLLDEVHEALDHEYRAIVQERAREILTSGGIVVAAGHDHPLLEQLSSRALWLDEGSIIADGPFETGRERLPGRRPGAGPAASASPSPSPPKDTITPWRRPPGPRSIPWDWYADPAVARLEQGSIFRRTWQYAAHRRVAEPGTFTTARAGDVPVVLVRGREGAPRLRQRVPPSRLHPLRRRRPARDAPVPLPRVDVRPRRLAAERAAGRPEPGFDRRASGSCPSPSTRGGRSRSSIPTRRRAARRPPRRPPRLVAAGGVDVDALVFHQRAEAEYDANWKVCVENYLECYHCAVAHPSFSKAIDVARAPTRSRSIRRSRASTGRRRTAAAASTTRAERSTAASSTCSSRYGVNVMPGRGNISIGPVRPRGAGADLSVPRLLLRPGRDEEWIGDKLELDDQVGAEDRRLVESVQGGSRAGCSAAGYLLPESEQLIARFQSPAGRGAGHRRTRSRLTQNRLAPSPSHGS